MNERILVVDDDRMNLEFVETILQNEDYIVDLLQHGNQLLSFIEENTPDLILLDIIMPKSNGIELCKQLKMKPQYQAIPVLFISGISDSASIVKGFEAGGVDYVNKPFKQEELKARIRTQLQLVKLRKKVLTKYHENENLLRILSHDLANHMQGILGYAEISKLLIDNKEEALLHIDSIKKITSNANELINHVRELIAVDSGKLEIKVRAVDLKEIVKRSLDTFHNRLTKKSLAIETNLNAFSEPVHVAAEPISLLNSVLNNLLSNAIKFSYPDNVIKITIEEETEHVFLCVQDFGKGISKRTMNALFNSSKATSTVGTAGEQGTGFGMPLVKRYVKKYNAEIFVASKTMEENEKNHGTTFTIKFRKA